MTKPTDPPDTEVVEETPPPPMTARECVTRALAESKPGEAVAGAVCDALEAEGFLWRGDEPSIRIPYRPDEVPSLWYLSGGSADVLARAIRLDGDIRLDGADLARRDLHVLGAFLRLALGDVDPDEVVRR